MLFDLYPIIEVDTFNGGGRALLALIWKFKGLPSKT